MNNTPNLKNLGIITLLACSLLSGCSDGGGIITSYYKLCIDGVSYIHTGPYGGVTLQVDKDGKPVVCSK